MKISKKILAITIFILVVSALVFYFLPYIKYTFKINGLSDKELKILNIVPEEKNIDKNQNFSNYLPLSNEELTINIPWIDLEDGTDSKLLTKFTFQSGNKVSLLKSKIVNPENEIARNNPETENKLAIMYGDSIKDPYQFEKLIYNTAPKKINIFTSRSEINKLLTSLSLKEMMIISENYIYVYTVNKLPVFQFDLSENTRDIRFYKDNKMYNIQLKGDISQNEVEYIIQSINIK